MVGGDGGSSFFDLSGLDKKTTNCKKVTELPPLVTAAARHRQGVFGELWRRGYYLTPGLRYGCDFMVRRWILL